MANLSRHRKTLLLISKSSPKAAKKIIAKANGSLIKAISEICLNILNGVIPLSNPKKRDIGRFKDSLRSMVGRGNLVAKRATLQRGGFLAALASVALPLIFKGASSLVSHIKKKRAQRSRRR